MAYETEAQHRERIEKYIREGRPVSGAYNPPDKYDLIQLTGDKATDLAAINASADQGYRVEDNQPESFTKFGYVLMNGYTE